MVPGIDFAGEVIESTSPDFKAGDMVLLNGWGGGRRTLGRSGAAGSCEGRLVDSMTKRIYCQTSIGNWYSRLYLDALCHGATKAWT